MPLKIACRLFCAATCAYDILADGSFTPCDPHYPAVGWVTEPAVRVAPDTCINACLIGTNQADGIILVFRGTLPPTNLNLQPQILDWLQDFNAQPIVPPAGGFPQGVIVHEGFWNAVESLWGQIVPALQAVRAANPDAKLYVTGHSKGGAMAALAAARLFFQEALSAAGVYLYASARAGNSAFVSTFPSDVPVVRYEHCLDVVPFLPPNLHHLRVIERIGPLDEIFKKVKPWDYTPLGTLQYVQRDGTVVGDSAGLSLQREEEIIRCVLAGGLFDIAKAHGPWCKSTFSDGGYLAGICSEGLCT